MAVRSRTLTHRGVAVYREPFLPAKRSARPSIEAKKIYNQGRHSILVFRKVYRMSSTPPILLDAAALQRTVSENIKIMVMQTIPSTNDIVKQHAITGENHMMYCFAEQQTAGRGRLARTWHSPFAQNIYVSCGYYSKKPYQELSCLSLGISLAIIRVLKQQDPAFLLTVKWPNDVRLNRKKVAGILIERHENNKIIIGLGLNVNMSQDETHTIHQPWTSLYGETGKIFDRHALAIPLIQEIQHAVQRFEATGLHSFLPEWSEYDALAGTWVTLQHAAQCYTGQVLGINVQGQLLLQENNGRLHAFSSGEVTLTLSATH